MSVRTRPPAPRRSRLQATAVIETAAADGRGAAAKSRVFGFTPPGSWAELARARGDAPAVIPAHVTDAQAASLPVAAGGVGRFACQLAALSGAEVCANSRRPDLAGLPERDGVVRATVFRGMAEAARVGSCDVILDSAGGGTQVGRAVRRSRMKTGMAWRNTGVVTSGDGQDAQFRPGTWAAGRVDQTPCSSARGPSRASWQHPPRGSGREAHGRRRQPTDQRARGRTRRFSVRAGAVGRPDDWGWCTISQGRAPHVLSGCTVPRAPPSRRPRPGPPVFRRHPARSPPRALRRWHR